MTAKEYLSKIRLYKWRAESLQKKCEELRVQAEGLKAITYDRDRVQTSPENRLEHTMLKLVDLENKYAAAIAKSHAAVQIRAQQIQKMDNPLYAEVLALRYVDGLSINQVAVEVQIRHPEKTYRDDYIRHVHGWALQAFEKQYPKIFSK